MKLLIFLLSFLVFSNCANASPSPIIWKASCGSGAYNVVTQSCFSTGGGSVTSVTADGPLASSGGPTPDISIDLTALSTLSPTDPTTAELGTQANYWNRLWLGDGAQGFPALVFASDNGTDTGIYHPSDGVIAFATNGQQSMVLDPSGNLTVAGTVNGQTLPITGNTNNFTGYDNSGNIFSIPGHNFDAVTFGDNIGLDAPYSGAGSFNMSNHNYNLIPSAPSPATNVNTNNLNVQVDPTSQGFDMGTGGSVVNLNANFLQHHGTSNTGSMTFITNYADLGNGTDPITISALTYLSLFGDINSGVTITNQIQGFGLNFNVHSGAAMGQNVRAFFDNSNVHIAAPGHESFSSSPNVDEIMNNHNMNAYEAGGNFPLFSGNSQYQGLGIFPNIGTINSGGFTGVSINPNITTAGSGFIAGINISMNNVTGYTGDPPYAINTSGGRVQFSSIATANQQGFGSGVDFETDAAGPTTGVFGLNALGGQLHIVAGHPIANGAFGIGNNLGIGIAAEDDFPPDGSGFNLGFVMNGFLTQIGAAAGKTFSGLTFMGAGASVPPGSTGGTFSDVKMFRAIGLVPGGGTATVSNIYGFYVDSLLTAMSPTNAWGIYVAAPDAKNYFAGEANADIGFRLSTSGSQPTCDVAHRGLMWNVQGGAGVADIFQVCQKNSSDVYTWTTH